ncbi:heat shock protein 30-like [Coregonus clupeaformis]|uniref:heat shock protein 30-like n=1 Tax=Coregonus clupeaformis TaxID=59861 RepID=UPI001BDFF881|nr:heat shock protein 30-like [Coregonus clupeaformis]
MLCSQIFQSSLSPLMDFYWPVCSLWPEVQPLFCQRDLLQRNMLELKSRLELMEKLQQHIFEEMDYVPASVVIQPVSYTLEKEGEGFALTLETKDFSPEELSVKQVGRKLRVSGKTEKKPDEMEGSYSYRCQEFRQEFYLPEGVNPETVTCSLDHDGKLHIEAPKNPLSAEEEVTERVVPINCSMDVKTPQFLSSQTEDSTTEGSTTEDSTTEGSTTDIQRNQ